MREFPFDEKNSFLKIIINIVVLFALIFMIFLIVFELLIFQRHEIFLDVNVHYLRSIELFWTTNDYYDINYLPSFFLLSPIILNTSAYLIFLISCSIGTTYLLFKLDSNILLPLAFSITTFFIIIAGNIDPFVFLIVLIACYYENSKYIPPILLAFICFKLTGFLIVPYFLYKAKNRFQFIGLFAACFVLYNIYFLFYPHHIFEFLAFGTANLSSIIFNSIRPWLFYMLYYSYMKVRRLKMIQSFITDE